MEPDRLFLAIFFGFVFFGGALSFLMLARHYPSRDGRPDELALVYAGLFGAFGVLLVPYALYDAYKEGFIRDCAQNRPYSQCRGDYD